MENKESNKENNKKRYNVSNVKKVLFLGAIILLLPKSIIPNESGDMKILTDFYMIQFWLAKIFAAAFSFYLVLMLMTSDKLLEEEEENEKHIGRSQ